MKKSIYNMILIFLSVILLTACENYNPIFKPRFKVSNDLVYSKIQKIIKVKDIHIEGYKIRVDDTIHISLIIRLINPIKLPKNEDSLKLTQKDVAKETKSLLKNPLQFKIYNIIFIQRDTVKGIMGRVTSERSLTHQEFSVKEL
ncbi:hypothetical protein [Flavobacterium sp.]|uniref:hypothetical protein n=1 Tax=Flavobacterium sp. TaxID=239 RepID=UPI00374D0169